MYCGMQILRIVEISVTDNYHYVHSMSSLQAMEWLIQHQGDTDIDDPISPAPTNKPQDITPSQAEATLLLSAADITGAVTEDSSATKKPEEHSTKVNKAKKPSRRRKWEFVPDQVVS